MIRNSCTIPAWFFGYRLWCNENIGDLCELHDEYYVTRNVFLKFYSDYHVIKEVFKRGHWKTGICAIPYFLIFGTIYWIYKSGNDAVKFIKGYK